MSINAVDYRLNWILHEGDTIQTADATYTITGKPIGLGGSSVLYPASKTGSDLEYAIKECFPAKPAVYQRINGIIKTANPDDELNQAQLVKYRAMLSNERKLGQKIRNATTRAVSVWDGLTPIAITTGGKTFTDVSGGIFFVLERMDKKGRFFNELLNDIRNACPPEEFQKTFGLPSIHMTARIMEQALLALQQVHKAGYYYGDLNGSNVFFSECEPKEERIGIGHLIDFGTTRKLEPDGFTTPIIDDSAYSSDGFRPFEIRDHKGRALRLSKQADIYSMGCLMLRCVHTPAKIKTYGDSPTVGSNALNEKNGKAIGCTGRTLQLVNEILNKATRYDPKERYADATEMLDAILELEKYTEPPRFLLPSNMSSPDFWVPHSRDQELSVLTKAVKDGETVFLHGVGGIGKTECAIQLAKRLDPPRGAYLVRFQDSMRETILKMNFSGYKFQPKQKGLSLEALEEAEYQERLEMLREHYRDTVLIIDNFDADNKTLDELRREPAFQDFLGLDLKRIFTTRYPVGRKDWEIRELSETALLELMRYYCSDASITDEQYLAILKEIQNHTLTAMLIAKTLEESWGEITPEMILEALRGSKLSQEEYPEVVSDQNRSYQQKQIYGHLKALYNLSGMSEDDRIVLCCATLLPNCGIDVPLFKKSLRQDEQKSLTNLVKRGWLKRTNNNTLTIHPIIREVCIGELKPDDKTCKRFLEKLWNHFNEKQYYHIQYLQMADCFALASHSLPNRRGDWAYCAGFLYSQVGSFEKGLAFLTQALEIQETIFPNGHPDMAESLDNIGDIYVALNIPEIALTFFRRAMELRRQAPHNPHPDMAISYIKLSSAYYFLFKPLHCLYYAKKALSMNNQGSSADSWVLAESLNWISGAYHLLGKYKKALQYQLQSVQVLEDTTSGYNQLVCAYTNLGALYGCLHMGTESIATLTKAIEIANENRPQNNPNLAQCYSHLGSQYFLQKEYSRAILYQLRAIELFEGIELVEKATIARGYFEAGLTYCKLENMEDSLVYLRKAIQIHQESSSPHWFEIGLVHFFLAHIQFSKHETRIAIHTICKGLRYILKESILRLRQKKDFLQ